MKASLISLILICAIDVFALFDHSIYLRGLYFTDKAYIYAPQFGNGSIRYIPTANTNTDLRQQPVIIYMTIDSAEPYMKIAIDKELQDLRSICKHPYNANWISLIGSNFGQAIAQNQKPNIEFCRNGKLATQNIPNKTWQKILQTLATYKTNSNFKMIKSTPNAAPEIFEELLNFIFHQSALKTNTTKDADYRLKTKYSYLLHIKSHGSLSNPILLLTADQLALKTKQQLTTILKSFGIREDDFNKLQIGQGILHKYSSIINDNYQNTLGKRCNDCLDISTQISSDQDIFKRKQFEKIFTSIKYKDYDSENRDYIYIDFLFMEACGNPVGHDQALPFWENQSEFEVRFANEGTFMPGENLIPPVNRYFISKGQLSYQNLSWLEIANKFLDSKGYQSLADILLVKTMHIRSLLPDDIGPSLANKGIVYEEAKIKDPENQYSDISIGAKVFCGVNQNQDAICAGEDRANPTQTSYLPRTRLLTPAELKLANIKDIYAFNWVNQNYKFRKISVGDDHACGITLNEKLYCWGHNFEGQLGITGFKNPNFEDNDNPKPEPISAVDSDEEYLDVSAGYAATCGITKKSKLKCWGSSIAGHTGKGLVKSKLANHTLSYDQDEYMVAMSDTLPTLIDDKNNYKMVSLAGDSYTGGCGITDEHYLKCWGSMSFNRNTASPVIIDNLTKYSSVAVSGEHACGLTINNQIKCWGSNSRGALGFFPEYNLQTNQPRLINSDKQFIQVATGRSNSCGITKDNELYCWGLTILLGLGEKKNELQSMTFEPTLMDPKYRFKLVRIGNSAICGLTSENNLRCWGNFSEAPTGGIWSIFDDYFLDEYKISTQI